jgi:hypothetical protein
MVFGDDPAFAHFITQLPNVSYFGNVLKQLKGIWEKIDEKVQSLTCESHELEKIFSWVEDQNEILMYFSDILVTQGLDGTIKDFVQLALLNVAYLPSLVNSLVVVSKTQSKKLGLNTCIFILIQTYKVLGDSAPKFLEILTIALFAKD